jgi:hypothetical protein
VALQAVTPRSPVAASCSPNTGLLKLGTDVLVVQYRISIRYWHALLRPLLRYRGRILPWREVINQSPKYGDLRIEETLDQELHRYVRMASLFDTTNVLPSTKLPQLLDARLMAMSPQAFTLTGFERIEGVEYAQSWLVSDCRS